MDFDFDDTYEERLKVALASGKICIVPHRIKEREKNMKITLTDGTVVEGSLEQVQRLARILGQNVPTVDDGVYYNSTSKGLIRIDGMENTHLRNALLARYRAFVGNLSAKTTPQVAQEIQNPSDKTLVGLMAELALRERRGRL